MALLVPLLAVGVVVMHSLGGGHQAMAGMGEATAVGHSAQHAGAAMSTDLNLAAAAGAAEKALFQSIEQAAGQPLDPVHAVVPERPADVAIAGTRLSFSGAVATVAVAARMGVMGAAFTGEGLMAMCLAVLTVLLLLRVPLWRTPFGRKRRASRPALTTARAGRFMFAFPQESPSPAKLCVLRM